MDKKGSRLVQSSAKGLSPSDSKKNQDAAAAKPWPRSGRRREAIGGSLASRGEPSRKPPPQRPKTFDIKRPKSRGAIDFSFADRTEATRLESEWGSVFSPGSKKQNLNHLLSFNSTASPPLRGEGRSYNSPRGDSNYRLISTKKHKYDKNQFLQANCQFVVNASGDYKQYMNDPDALVSWSLVEQVNVQDSNCPSCPICLDPPIAAKMTKCGHIYCWSCILHYLHFLDQFCYKQCPLCVEHINKNDFKSVVSKHHTTFNTGDIITFKLMKRAKGSLVTYPATSTVRNDGIFKFSESDTLDAYSKLLLANNSEILSIIDREYNELTVQKLENDDCSAVPFIEEAISLLDKRREKVLDSIETTSIDTNLCKTLNNLELSEASEKTKYSYFYQASDGQHIYLHAINARMLEHTYGSLEFGPTTVTGKILEKEGGSMTEEIRKSLRYLQHIPLTCQFEVAEIELKQSILNTETLKFFNEQLITRKKRRQRRARDERRREKKIAVEEDRLLGKYPIPILHIESEDQFPTFDRVRTESESTQPSELSSQATPPNSLNIENESAGPSFAKILANDRKDEVKWPALKATTSTLPRLVNVTGQTMNSGTFDERSRSDSDPELESSNGHIPRNLNLGDVLHFKLQKDTQHSGKKNKKKKKKPIDL